MKTNKLLLPYIFLTVTLIAFGVVMLACCYETTPAVKSAEFPFSITYEYNGEIGTLKGVTTYEFAGSETIMNEHSIYWDEETIYENPEELEYPWVIVSNEEMFLGIHTNMRSGYFMGDPHYANYYNEYGNGTVEPYIDYTNHKEEIYSSDDNREEIMESIGFRLIDFTYAEPIENSFTFSGIQFQADNVIFFVAISVLFLVLCVIFVRRDKEYKYTVLDKVSIAVNFIVGIVAVPFITIICVLFDLNGGGDDILSQIAYCIPAPTIVCLGLSVAFRRKGFRKIGFFIQFAGVLAFIILLSVSQYVYMMY